MISATKLKWLFMLSMAFSLSTAKEEGNSIDTQIWNCKVKQESSQQVSTHLIECIRGVLQPDNSEDESESEERRSPADASKDAPEAAKQSTGSLRETTTLKPANGNEEKSGSKKTNADPEATTTKSTRSSEKDNDSKSSTPESKSEAATTRKPSNDADSETTSTPETESETTADKADSEEGEEDAEKEETTTAKSIMRKDAGSKPTDVEKTAAKQIAEGNASGVAAKLPRQTDRNAFLLCFGRISGQLNEDGSYNAEKAKNYTNEFDIDETVKVKIEQGIDECGSANKDNVEAILGCIADTYNKIC